MAATYTEVSLEDMDKFLKRAFRTLRPNRNQQYNEYYYDLKLGKFVGIRVWSSIGVRSGQGAQVGSDAIRVQLISLKDNRPLEKGKAPIVKRTQGWRNSLQDRIEDCIEKYEDNDTFWEGWAETRQMRRDAPPSREPARQPDPEPVKPEERDDQDTDPEDRPAPPGPSPDMATDKQVGYAAFLLRNVSNTHWFEMIEPKFHLGHIPTRQELARMSKRQISLLIDLVKRSSGGGGRRYADDEDISGVEYDYSR